jgi:hypothetical protein
MTDDELIQRARDQADYLSERRIEFSLQLTRLECEAFFRAVDERDELRKRVAELELAQEAAKMNAGIWMG